MKKIVPKLFTASGIVTSQDAFLNGFLIGTDGINDPTITIYKGTAAVQGNEIMPTTTFDASKQGLHGFVLGYEKQSFGGMYIEITCAGSCEVVLDVGFD